MKFCEQCGTILREDTTQNKLIHVCDNCYEQYDSTPRDTLVAEVRYTERASGDMAKTFEENSPFDTAGLKVAVACPKCNYPFLTRIFVGDAFTAVELCVCGYRSA